METMANYILKILKYSFSIFCSWGVTNLCALDNDSGLSFNVNGFLYKGKVSVIYNRGADLFNVIIGQDTYTDIYFDELADFIDSKVEKECSDDEYELQVKKCYNL